MTTIKQLRKESENLFISQPTRKRGQQRVTFRGNVAFRIPKDPSFEGHDPCNGKSDDDLWRELMVPHYRGVVESTRLANYGDKNNPYNYDNCPPLGGDEIHPDGRLVDLLLDILAPCEKDKAGNQIGDRKPLPWVVSAISVD
jgi:hypothetical protein